MTALKELINKVPQENHEYWFREIAELLFSKYKIVAGENEYRLTEIEFYYHSSTHPDETAYGYIKEGVKYAERIKNHKLRQQDQLTWFIHYSGIDIVFGNIGSPGGILIRSIRNIVKNIDVKGPLVVLLELLNQGTKVETGEPFTLILQEVEQPFSKVTIKPTKRVGIAGEENEKRLYNFSIENN